MRHIVVSVFLAMGLVLLARPCRAQTVSFAEDIDSTSGKLIRPNTKFYIETNGGTIQMLVTLKHKIGVGKVTYKVYRLSDKGDKYLDQTINDNVKKEWLWFFTELYIRSPGHYVVEVYRDGSDKMIASGKVEFIAKADGH